jgi:alpha-L-fucosidase
VTKPSGSTLKLRDNGYKVTSVTNFRTGAAVSFSQSGGTLTLSGISSWDQFDTVFQVNTAGRQNIYPASSYTMSATASASGHGASAAADGNYLTYWDGNKTSPVSLMWDLGSTKRIQYLGINQREDSVSYPRSDTEQSARIKNYRVFVSSDGTNWGNPVATGTLPSDRGVAMIDLPATNTRHVRLEVQNTYAASSDSTRFKRLRVDEAWVASDYAGAGGGSGATTYEAENATCQGTIESDHAGFTGTGFCNTDNAAGAFAQWSVTAASAGSTTLTIRSANGTTADRLSDVSVNGTVVSRGRSFPSTGDWTSWVTTSLPVTLTAGSNTIRITGTTANGAANLDNISIG